MKNTLFGFVSIIFFSLFIFLTTSIVEAANIATFTTSNSSAFSGQLISLSWSGDGYGYNLSVSCATGVKIKKEDGSVYPCDTKVATSNQASNSMGFYLVNISGSSKNVTFKLYPKSNTGEENTSGMQFQTVSISPSVAPITSFTTSATSTTSGSPVVLTWTGHELDGINLIFSCVDGVGAYAAITDVIALPCNRLAYTDKLAGSGSVSIYFKNKYAERAEVDIKALPYIGDGSYDLTHSLSLSLDVASDKALPGQVLSFASSKPKVASSDTLSLVWSTKNMTGVNLRVDCNESLSFSLATTSGGQTVKCNSLMSETYFGANSSVDIVITSTSKDAQTAYVTLLPQLPGGGFDGVNAKKIAVTVVPLGQTVIYTAEPQTVSASNSGGNNIVGVAAKTMIAARKKFYTVMSFGSRGDDVVALQEFLLNNGYLSNTSATGYFGVMTRDAVQRFQEAMGIAKKGQAGYGNVGPMTRAKINSF